MKIINEHADQYRTPKATRIGPSGLAILTTKVTDAALIFATNIVALELLGDLYPKTTKQSEIQHTPATLDRRKQSTTVQKVKTLLDVPQIANRTIQPRTQTIERQHPSTKEETPQPLGSCLQTKTTKGNKATFERDRIIQMPMV